MGGVVIGSSMENVAQGQNWLALFINVKCNLDCSICYLGEKKSKQPMSIDMAKRLNKLAREYDGVAVIGTEALFDEQSVEIVNLLSLSNRTHIITNGVNLEKFADKITRVQRVDVSLDGGPKSYPRGASFAKICDGARMWKDLNNGELYVLNVLYGANIQNIDDMLEGGHLFNADGVLFSPFVSTLGGRSQATPLSTEEIVQSLLPFAGGNWKLMVDPYHAIFEWRNWDTIKEVLKQLPEKNLLLIDFDPGDRVKRVGIDGSEKHPFLALHPGIILPGKKFV